MMLLMVWSLTMQLMATKQQQLKNQQKMLMLILLEMMLLMMKVMDGLSLINTRFQMTSMTSQMRKTMKS